MLLVGEYDFIRAKAKLATDIKGEYPVVVDKAHVHLVKAYHPLIIISTIKDPENQPFR